VQQGSFTLSAQTLMIGGFFCPPASAAFDITNTSSVPLAWHVSGNPSTMQFTPPSSTLAAGGTISVSLSSTASVKSQRYVVSVDADIAPSQSLQILIAYGGYFVDPPADIDFGNVPVGQYATIFIPLTGSYSYPGTALVSSNSAFDLSGTPPNQVPGGFGWSLRFHSLTAGPQQTTLEFISVSGAQVCLPKTFIARAVAVAP
jgi:hypothetical protein